jgi:hypothetical protein
MKMVDWKQYHVRKMIVCRLGPPIGAFRSSYQTALRCFYPTIEVLKISVNLGEIQNERSKLDAHVYL